MYVFTRRSPIFASTCEREAVHSIPCNALIDTLRSLSPDEVDFALSEEMNEMMAGTNDAVTAVAWSCVSFPECNAMRCKLN
jgi:hypothetical protein